VAHTINSGTFHQVGEKGKAPPAQSGQLTVILLERINEEIERRKTGS